MSKTVSRSISPDSGVSCSDPQCFINIDHNIGRFFDNGLTASDVQSELDSVQFRGVITFTAFFNGTVPTTSIIEAFVRLNEGRSSPKDEEKLKSFKNLHCFQPLAFDIKSYRCSAERQHKHDQESKGERKNHTSSLKQGCCKRPSIRRQKAQVFRPLGKKDFGASAAPEATIPASVADFKTDGKEEDADASKANAIKRIQSMGNPLDELRNLKTFPTGRALQEVQLDIQLRICKQIAEHAAQRTESKDHNRSVMSHIKNWRSHVHSRSDSGSHSSSDKSPEAGTEIDHRLEIHVATIRKLETRLENGSWRDIDIVDPLGRPLRGDIQRDFLESMLLIIRRMLREIIADLNSEYCPTKSLATESEQVALLEEYTSTIDMLGDVYPHMEIAHIMEALDKTGERARLTKIF